MLKPLGVERQLGDFVRERVERAGLRWRCCHRAEVSVAQADALCTLDPTCHHVERGIVHTHFTGRELEFHVVDGADALRRTLELRNQVRAARSEGAFANLVHAPDSTYELHRQARALLRGCAVARQGLAPEDDADLRPRTVIDGTPRYSWPEVSTIVSELWMDRSSVVWRGPDAVRPWVVGPGDATLSIRRLERVPLDLVVVTLLDALPGLPLRHAIELALQGVHCPDYAVATGAAHALDAIRRSITTVGLETLVADWVPAEPAARPLRA